MAYICNLIAIKLNLNKKYKIILAAFLLGLYAFIVTPVSYWHQHNFSNSGTSKKQYQETIAKSSVMGTDANCKICSHHYSVSDDDAVALLISPTEQLSALNGFFFTKDVPNPGYCQSNKGPPSSL